MTTDMTPEDTRHTALRHKITAAHPGASILGTFTITWHNGWDADDALAVIQTGRHPYAVTTNHGRLERITKPEVFLRGTADYTVPEAVAARALLDR